MKMKVAFAVMAFLVITCAAQKSPYAGLSGYGYPIVTAPTVDPLANKFGEDTPTTTITLPIEALGDVELVKRLMKLPIDQRPFWLINWQALQDNRNNPITYDQRENNFIDLNRN